MIYIQKKQQKYQLKIKNILIIYYINIFQIIFIIKIDLFIKNVFVFSNIMFTTEIAYVIDNINFSYDKYKLPTSEDMIYEITSDQLQYIIEAYGRIPNILQNTTEWVILESEYNTKSCNYYWGVNGDYSVVLIHKDFNINNTLQFILFGSK